jgi:hypothetical protein
LEEHSKGLAHVGRERLYLQELSQGELLCRGSTFGMFKSVAVGLLCTFSNLTFLIQQNNKCEAKKEKKKS